MLLFAIDRVLDALDSFRWQNILVRLYAHRILKPSSDLLVRFCDEFEIYTDDHPIDT